MAKGDERAHAVADDDRAFAATPTGDGLCAGAHRLDRGEGVEAARAAVAGEVEGDRAGVGRDRDA